MRTVKGSAVWKSIISQRDRKILSQLFLHQGSSSGAPHMWSTVSHSQPNLPSPLLQLLVRVALTSSSSEGVTESCVDVTQLAGLLILFHQQASPH